MPFVKRKIEPHEIRRHKNDDGEVFEEHSDVANNALVNALLQLSSVTYHAEDIFREMEEEMKSIYKRCSKINGRLEKLQKTTEELNPKEVQIPVSDLDSEMKIPLYLHYHACDSMEEDFFTADTRTPCLIHLHQLARSDLSGVLRGSQAYAKSPRPKSLDPRILLQSEPSPRYVAPANSTINIVASPELTELYNPQSLLPTPKEKMEIESSQHKAQVVAVDTSGSQFERRVNMRRSQRSSISAVRRKSQHKFRERHKTLTALPGSVTNELGLNGMLRPNSMHSDVNSNSSFFGEGSVASGDSTFTPREKQNNEIQTDDVTASPTSPIRRRMRNRLSMPVVKSVPVSPQRGARVSLQHSDDNSRTFPRNQPLDLKTVESGPRVHNGHVPAQEEGTSNKQLSFMREKNNMGEDRTSSGFWSGTESCRHSTTSEILMQHHNVTQALQQILSKKPTPMSHEPRQGHSENDTNASTSTLSINSRLSILEQSPSSSSVASLSQPSLPQSTDLAPSPDNSVSTPRTEPRTPCQLTFSTPAGAYNFMNPSHVETQPKFQHLASPMDLLILGNRRGNDGLIRHDTSSPLPSPGQNGYSRSIDNNGDLCKGDLYLDKHSVFTPNTPRTVDVYNVSARTPLRNGAPSGRFFGTDFIANDERLRQKQFLRQQKQQSVKGNNNNCNSLQSELKARLCHEDENLKKPYSKPPPPNRASSLKSPRYHEAKEILAYMEPLSGPNKMSPSSPSPQTPVPDKLPNYYQVHSSKLFGIPGSVERKRMSSATSPSSSSKPSTPTGKGELMLLRNNGSAPRKSDSFFPKRHIPITEAINQHSTPTSHTELSITVHERPVSATQAPTKSPLVESNHSPLPTKSSSANRFTKPSSLVNRPLLPPTTPDEVIKPSQLALSPAGTPTPQRTVSDDAQAPLPVDFQTSAKSPQLFASPKTKASVPYTKLNLEEAPTKIDVKDLPENVADKPSTLNNLEQVEKNKLPTVSPDVGEPSTNDSTVIKPFVSPDSVTNQQKKFPVKPLVVNPVRFQPVRTGSPKVDDQKLSPKEPHVLSPVKPPVAAKPSRQLSARPAVRPKPLLLPKPKSVKERNNKTNNGISRIRAGDQHVKDKTANARAAFFGLPSPTTSVKSNEEKAVSPVPQLNRPKQDDRETFNGETDIDAVDEDQTEGKIDQQGKETSVVDLISATAAVPSESKVETGKSPSLPEETEHNEEALKPSPEEETTEEHPEPVEENAVEDKVEEEGNAGIAKRSDEISKPVDAEKVDSVNERRSPQAGVEERDGSSGNVMTAENISSPASTHSKTADFLTTMHKLRGSLRPSSPDGNGHRQSVLSPPPNLDRRSNARHSTSSVDRRRKMNSGSTSREDFKALLLQSFSKPGSGSQMSAAEKLQMSLQSSKVNGTNSGDGDASDTKQAPESAHHRIVSMGDLRAAMNSSRPGRRQNRTPDLRLSYAGSTSYTNKKHPPISHGGRYSVRSKTPTRPMLAISEDSETEVSPDKKEERTRSHSVPHL